MAKAKKDVERKPKAPVTVFMSDGSSREVSRATGLILTTSGSASYDKPKPAPKGKKETAAKGKAPENAVAE